MSQHINRRDFLKSSTAALAAFGLPNITPASAFGANDRISLGGFGIGGMGTANMQNFLRFDGCRVVAKCDTYKDRQEKAKHLVDPKYGDKGCAVFGDFRELIARKDIDADMIAVQDHWHALVATSAAVADEDMYRELK